MSEVSDIDTNSGMPSEKEIMRRLGLKGSDPEKLVITPLINPDEQVEDGSIDLRLSTEFVLTKRSKLATLDPLNQGPNIDLRILEYQEKIHVGIGHELILHPHQFALGTTFEYVKIPVDLVGYVLGRSSWGRLGLIIATATVIHPRYAGIITLELTNLGDTPITLYPGTRVAQLALHKVSMTNEEKAEKLKEAMVEKTKYKASVNPVFSKIHEDDEWDMLRYIRKESKKKHVSAAAEVTLNHNSN